MGETSQWLVLMALLVPVTAASVFLLRPNRRRGGHWWAWGWAFLWLSGPLSLADGTAVEVLARMGGTAFVVCLLAGSFAFSQSDRPPWLLPIGVVSVVLNGLLLWQAPRGIAQVIAMSTELPLFMAAAWVIRPRPAEPRYGRRFLAGVFLIGGLITVVELAEQYRQATFDALLLPLWVAFGFHW